MTLLGLALAALAASGCAQAPGPVAAPSGEQPAYAEAYPARLGGLRSRFASDETAARSSIAEFKAYPDKVKGANYQQVKAIVERADESGRSSDYADAALEAESIQRFLEEEKDPLRQKVAGGVAYAAKQKDCSEDLGGAAVASMERGIDKQLEERLRRHNEAHRYIEEHADELGKANADTLEKQADVIARTSHIAFVRLELYRRDLEASLDEASDARSTLARTVTESDTALAEGKPSAKRRAVLERRKSAAQAASSQLDSEVEQGRAALTEMEQRIGNLQREYDTALEALVDDLERRAEAAPATAAH